MDLQQSQNINFFILEIQKKRLESLGVTHDVGRGWPLTEKVGRAAGRCCYSGKHGADDLPLTCQLMNISLNLPVVELFFISLWVYRVA